MPTSLRLLAPIALLALSATGRSEILYEVRHDPIPDRLTVVMRFQPRDAKTILQMLLREGKLTRISMELVLHSSAIAQLKTQLQSGSRLSVPQFKELTGVSRKYAIPLLEFLDRQHITRRDGDVRVVA